MQYSIRKYYATACTLMVPFLIVQACHAESVSPSPKTRTLSAPLDNYYEQVTKGHPYRWFDTDMAIKVLIKPGAGVPMFKPQQEEILRAAFQTWEANSKSKIKFRYVTEPPADITCQFVMDIPKEKPEVAGITNYQTSPHHMYSALIRLKTSSTIAPLTDSIFRAVCLHEIGHALGLVNHSLDPHDVMYPYLTQQHELSSRDLKTINMLYDFEPPDSVLQLAREQGRDPAYPFGLIVLSGTDYDAYTRTIVAKVLKHFSAFSSGPMLECSIRCFVDSTGNIFNYRIFQPSTNDAFDRKVLEALVSSVPLPPVPLNLQKDRRSKTPIAFKFRSDGWIIPYVEPDPNQSDWLKTNEEPSSTDMMKELNKNKNATPKIIDPGLEAWIIAVSQKAHEAWKITGKGKTEVVLGIRKDGKIAHLVIVQPSGSEVFDNSVLNACISAEPYPAPPNASQDTTEVNLLFEP